MYEIDEPSQQLLVYLASHGETSIPDLVERTGVESKQALRARIADAIGPDAANLVTAPRVTQMTIDGSEGVDRYRLTEEGDVFVTEHLASLSMPADFRQLAETVAQIQDDITDLNDSMHRIDADELSTQLTEVMSELEEVRARISAYD